MTKLPVLAGLEVIKLLQAKGFVAVRQRGSHVRLERMVDGKTIKLTVPLHKEIKKGTLVHILKDAGMGAEDLPR